MHTVRSTFAAKVTLNNQTSTWTYDQNGNLLADGSKHYTWDAENRLLSITDTASGQITTFAYEGFDRRVTMTQNGTQTKYLWCGETICAARDNSGVIKARYFPQGEINGSASYYYARDNLGSVMALLDSKGSEKGSATYDAYGRTLTTTGIAPTFGYAGMFHSTTGSYLTHYRAYSPEAGRWLSRDPIGEVGRINLYAYVNGNPVNLIDPLGLYGTASCAYYTEACNAAGGYACAAQHICPVFPQGQENGWFQCIRQCLQEEDKRREQSKNSCPVRDNPFTDHTTCFAACAVNGGNPGLPGFPPRPGSDIHW